MADGAAPAQPKAAPAASIAASTVDAHAVACASALFLERGMGSVKMTDIADAAGMGVATLYRHFSTKASIAVAGATLMWEHLAARYAELVSGDGFAALDGARRLEALLRAYCDQCVYQPGFAAFVDELDRLMMDGSVAGEAVASYERAITLSYPYFEQAYRQGRSDGSITIGLDFPLFYRTVAHALMSVAAKLQRGEVLPTDDFSSARPELDCLVDMAIRSLTRAE